MISFLGGGKGPGQRVRPLVPGATVRARVVSSDADGAATLRVGRHEVNATASAPMKPGSTVRMRVTHMDPTHISLRQLTFADHPVGRYLVALRNFGRQGPFRHLSTLLERTLPDSKGPVGQWRATLHQFVTQIAIRPGKSDAHDLRRMVQGSGLMYEHNLGCGDAGDGDIKGLSMKLAQAIKKESSLSQAVKALIDGIEKLQVVNRATGEISGRFLMPLPLYMDDRLHFGQLLIDRGKKGRSGDGGEDRVTRMAMHVTLTKLGETRVDLSLFKGVVVGTITVTTGEAERRLTHDMETLSQALAEKGVSVRQMRIKRVPPEALAATSLVDDLVDAVGGLYVAT